MNIFIVEDGAIVQADYEEMVLQYAEQTTTPNGVGPKYHIREEVWFKVGNDLFDRQYEAEEVADDAEQDTGDRPAIEEVVRFVAWTWGHQGNCPRRITTFETQEEADAWLFECAEIDFQNDCNSPLWFGSQEEAESWIKENTPCTQL